MVSFLPPEVWGLVTAYLWLEDLERFTLVSKLFYKVGQRQLLQHRKWHLECALIEPNHGYDRTAVVPWYQCIVQLLQRPTMAYYWTEISTSVPSRNFDRTSYERARAHRGGPSLIKDNDLRLIIEAGETYVREVFPSDGFPDLESLKNEFRSDVQNLNHAALLAIIISRLPNLRILELCSGPYRGLWRVHWVELMLEWIHLDIKRNPDRERHERPLSRLEHIRCPSVNYATDLESIAPYMALPSVRWLEAERNEEEGFDWPKHLPRSHLREILIDGGTIAEETIRKFAAEALVGPCVIRQSGGEGHWRKLPSQSWNRLEIPHCDAAKDEMVVELIEDKVPTLVDWQGPTQHIGWEVKPNGTRRWKIDDEDDFKLQDFNMKYADWELQSIW